MPKQQQQQLENKQIGFEEEKIVNSSNNPITNLDLTIPTKGKKKKEIDV
jgi:hypothetical protein